MADLELWLHVVASIGTIYEIIQYGADYTEAFARRLREPGTKAQAARLAATFSTYSDDEVKELSRRVEQCRQRFIAEGSGKDRARCLCNVLRDVKDGNGGTIPLPEWEEMYRQLGCAVPVTTEDS
jgi:hypothetical protein